MFRRIGATAATVLLAACSEAKVPTEPLEATDISLVELRALVADQGLLVPGRYRVSAKIESVAIPFHSDDDMQAQAIGQMIRDKMRNVPEVTSEYCMGPDAAFDPRGEEVVECRVPSFRMVDSDVVFTMTCPTPAGDETSSAEFTGTMEEGGYALSSITKVPVTPGPTAETREATISAKVTGERLGECG